MRAGLKGAQPSASSIVLLTRAGSRLGRPCRYRLRPDAPTVRRDFARLRQLDYADRRLVATRATRPASERRLQLPDRRVTRPADRIQRHACPCLASTTLDLQPAVTAVQ